MLRCTQSHSAGRDCPVGDVPRPRTYFPPLNSTCRCRPSAAPSNSQSPDSASSARHSYARLAEAPSPAARSPVRRSVASKPLPSPEPPPPLPPDELRPPPETDRSPCSAPPLAGYPSASACRSPPWRRSPNRCQSAPKEPHIGPRHRWSKCAGSPSQHCESQPWLLGSPLRSHRERCPKSFHQPPGPRRRWPSSTALPTQRQDSNEKLGTQQPPDGDGNNG